MGPYLKLSPLPSAPQAWEILVEWARVDPSVLDKSSLSLGLSFPLYKLDLNEVISKGLSHSGTLLP